MKITLSHTEEFDLSDAQIALLERLAKRGHVRAMAAVIKEQLFQEAVAVTVIEANWDFL